MKTPGPDPTKAYESWSVGQDTVERSADLGTTDDTAMEDLERRQESAMRRIRGNVRDKDGLSRLSFASGANAFNGDDDGDDALLDTVFGRHALKRKLEGAGDGGEGREDDKQDTKATAGSGDRQDASHPTSKRKRINCKSVEC